ncbi:MAG TPA: hypothetical protein VK348_14975, partial [Planctomycetota bacterium]|nr:hypothetical protein [Planctomycetota bacterium]
LAVAAVAWLAGAVLPAQTGKLPDGWTSGEIHGFDVRVKATFATNALHQQVLEILTDHLARIVSVLPAEALAKLRAIPIWVGDEDARHVGKAMFYHPSAEWLQEHEQREFLARGVEIACARNFIAWQKDQPWMVLHELAHGYHHQVLGHDHKGIRDCFAAAKKSGKYEHVQHTNGQTLRHYALTDEREFFAEASEAFFGRNDFQPFDRAELKIFDPAGYALMLAAWGVAETK